MDITSIKRKISEMEDRGAYNEAIEFLYDQWIADMDNPELCAVFLGECVWTCAYEHDIECAFPDTPVICNFLNRMIDALEYGIEQFKDDFMFQLRVGYLLYSEELWFYGKRFSFEEIRQLASKMIQKAYELRPSSKVAECLYRIIAKPSDDTLILSLDREARKQELDCYHLEETADDMTFRRFLIE